MYFIGIDLGTSAVKLMLTDEHGSAVKTVSETYPIAYPHPHWSEQNPADWWDAVCRGMEALLSDVDRSLVGGVGVGGQMHGLVMLDEADRPLRPAILWNDTRTEPETRYLNEEIGRTRLQDATGNIAFSGFTAPKILWVQKNEPEVFAKCRRLCLPKDYINLKLTGVFATDVSDASGTLYFDVEHRRWSDEMLGIFGISKAMLPAVYESGDKIGQTTLFGLDAAVAAGAGDNAAAAVGTATVNEGQCNISLGTSGTVFLPTDRYVRTPNPALHSFCHANGKYHLMGCILTAASANKWLTEEILRGDYGEWEAPVNPENSVYFMPYLSGERCPHNDGDVKGAFLGLTHAVTRTELAHAVFEGVSFAIRDCVALCPEPVKEATVCGGGAKSGTWMQILSSVLGIPIRVIENEGPALGGAVLGAKAAGVDMRISPVVKATVFPDKTLSDVYARKYRKFATLYPMLKAFYKEET